MVVIAHNVDPIELVVFLSTLCWKMGSLAASSRKRPGWGVWYTGRHTPLPPSHRLNLMKSAATGEAASFVPNL